MSRFLFHRSFQTKIRFVLSGVFTFKMIINFELGYFWFFVDSQQEAWHDKIFDTVVLADRGQI